MSDRLPTLQEAINIAVELGLRNLSTMIPAKVVKWDSSKCQADCQILVKQVTEGEDGSREVASWPVVPGVPVQFVGAGNYRITCPIENGTIGVLVFSHRSLDKWLSGSGSEVDPEFDHDHALTDAVFVPGLKPFGATWQDIPSSGMSIGKDSGLQMAITDDAIVLATSGGANAQYVALSNKVATELNKILTTLNSATAAGGGAAVVYGTPYVVGSVAASKVKAE